jgi:hypothetical protein
VLPEVNFRVVTSSGVYRTGSTPDAVDPVAASVRTSPIGSTPGSPDGSSVKTSRRS